MSYSQAVRLRAEEQRSLAFGSISATYAGIGAKLSHPARIIMVDNLTDADLQFSIDGITDHFVVARRSGKIIDISSNQAREHGIYLSEADRLYVKEIGGPTSGSVYFSVFYGSNS